MVFVVAIHEDDGQIVVVEFSAEPGQIVPALAGQGPVAEVPELDDPAHLVLARRWEQDVLPVQPVAVGVADDQEAGRIAEEGSGHRPMLWGTGIAGNSLRARASRTLAAVCQPGPITGRLWLRSLSWCCCGGGCLLPKQKVAGSNPVSRSKANF